MLYICCALHLVRVTYLTIRRRRRRRSKNKAGEEGSRVGSEVGALLRPVYTAIWLGGCG